MVKKPQPPRKSKQATPVKPSRINKKTKKDKVKVITVSIDAQMAKTERSKDNSKALKKLASDTGFSTQQLAVRWDLVSKLNQKEKSLIDTIAQVS